MAKEKKDTACKLSDKEEVQEDYVARKLREKKERESKKQKKDK